MITTSLHVCPWCGQSTRYEFVRGHYECTSCRRPVVDCCDGERMYETEKNIEAAKPQRGGTTVFR
jgi:hypothetical protein